MKHKENNRKPIIPEKPEAFETLALANMDYLHQPGNISIPDEMHIIEAKLWVDENEK